MVEPSYHPEFGYLRPSAGMVRRVRMVVISASAGILIGAGIVLSLVDRRFGDSQRSELGDGRRSEQSEVARRMDQDPTGIGRAANSENQAALVANPGNADVPIVREACKDEDGSFLNQKCRLIRKRRAHASGPIATRLGTVEIGGIRSAAEVGRPASAGVKGKSAQADGGSPRSADELPAPPTAAPENAAAPAAKSAKRLRIRQRPREPRGEGTNAFAYAPPYFQFNHSGETYRSGPKGHWGWSW
jgi:hypothetical protein